MTVRQLMIKLNEVSIKRRQLLDKLWMLESLESRELLDELWELEGAGDELRRRLSLDK